LQRLFPGTDTCNYVDFPDRGKGFNCVVHLAVLNNNTAASRDEYFQINVDLALEVLENAKKNKIPRFINFSTVHALDPDNQSGYASSKRIAATRIAEAQGIDTRSLYIPAVTGDKLTGRLGALNRLPRPLRRLSVKLFSAIVPTVDIKRVLDSCWTASSEAKFAHQQIITNDQSENPFFVASKRLIDIAAALFILLPFSWLLLLIWFAVRLQSTGPGIFAQQRIGQNGRTFTCYKFRTMSNNAPNVGTHEAPIAMVTPLGHLLRRTKLDELPQAVNILLNHMSLVGPRPSLPSQVLVIKERNARGVLAIKPGITGLAQIDNIDMSRPELLAERDERYLKLRSLQLDVTILVATAFGHGRGDAITANEN
jgi:lipopolysaccharide/colanic/teichoic acid biosynthesis glycosyltransferase